MTTKTLIAIIAIIIAIVGGGVHMYVCLQNFHKFQMQKSPICY